MFNQAVRSRDNGRSLKRKVNAAFKTLKANAQPRTVDLMENASLTATTQFVGKLN